MLRSILIGPRNDVSVLGSPALEPKASAPMIDAQHPIRAEHRTPVPVLGAHVPRFGSIKVVLDLPMPMPKSLVLEP